MDSLTEKQRKVLGYFLSCWEKGQRQPTHREICSEFGFASPRAAADHIAALKRKGYLAENAGAHRGLHLTDKALGVPLLGGIAAGSPVGEEESAEAYLPVHTRALGISNRENAFLLRVRGDSMVGRRIFDGDLVLIERTDHLRNRDVVAALIDNESTLKTYVRERGKTWLKSENPKYPNLIPAWELRIQGVARTVIRPLS